MRTIDQDGRIAAHGVTDEAGVNRLHKVLGYADGINLDLISDGLDPAKNEEYWYTPH